MSKPPLGRLERVDLRKIWPLEEQYFTPWLTNDGFALLAETLGLDLDRKTVDIEKQVGHYRADIRCKKTDSDTWVVIENQYGKSDHPHLGKLLTYAAGMKAVTIIWIAESFTEEHRTALDQLNEITNEDFSFFGLEIRLWKIGDSSPAPQFNVVSKPNEQSRPTKLTSDERMQEKYWNALESALKEAKGPISGTSRMEKRSKFYMNWTYLRSHCRLATVIERQHKRIGAEFFVKDSRLLERLKEEKNEIDREFKYPLEWEPSKIICRKEVDLENEPDWPSQHEWLAGRLNDLHRVFSDRVKRLNIDDRASDD